MNPKKNWKFLVGSANQKAITVIIGPTTKKKRTDKKVQLISKGTEIENSSHSFSKSDILMLNLINKLKTKFELKNLQRFSFNSNNLQHVPFWNKNFYNVSVFEKKTSECIRFLEKESLSKNLFRNQFTTWKRHNLPFFVLFRKSWFTCNFFTTCHILTLNSWNVSDFDLHYYNVSYSQWKPLTTCHLLHQKKAIKFCIDTVF